MKEQVKIIHKNVGGNGGFVFFMAFVGALIYFLQQASTFWEGLIGILKAIVWPAFLTWGVLNFLKL